MANEPSDEPGSEPAARGSSASRHVLVAGIAGACLLGAGAGLWARPADEDQRKPVALATAKPAPKPAGRIEIVLTDPLAPAAPVRPHTQAAIAGPAVSAEILGEPPPVPAAELAPLRPPPGLMRVDDPGPPQAEAPPAPDRAAEAAKIRKAALEKTRLQAAKLERAKLAKAEKLRLEKTGAEAKRKADLRLAKAAKAERAKDVRVAEEAAIEVAETETPGRLSRLKTVIAKPFKARKAEPALAPDADLAKADPPRKKPKAAEAVKLAKAEAAKPARKAPSKRCVSSDPGEAIVCADPGLAAADRQLSRAYREAEAAGVPAWQLKQQQQRWLAARAAAAREAPWAVHDVYLARIAELHDMTRDARGDY